MDKRELIEQIKAGVTKEAAGMRELNKKLPVTGDRFDIHCPDRDINVVYYKAKTSKAPLVIGFHGGGFLFGGNAMNDHMWTAVRDYLDVNVASIEYRKSPDYRWREALADAYDAALYFADHAQDHDYDPEQIWTMGGSAGAGLATRLCLLAKQRGGVSIKKQILMYPFLDSYTDPESKGKGSLEAPIMYVFNELHCESEEAKLPLVSPIFASGEDLEGMPEAIICLADFDALKHEGRKYGEMLKEAGVPVVMKQFDGMTHGYFEYIGGENFPGEYDFLDPMTKEIIANGELEKGAMASLEFVKANL